MRAQALFLFEITLSKINVHTISQNLYLTPTPTYAIIIIVKEREGNKMMEHDFLEHAGTLTTKEIDDIISKLNRVKEVRADEVRHAAAQKVIDAIAEYLKLGEEISIEGEVWNEDWNCHENVEAIFNDCFEKNGYLTFTFTE